MLARLSAFVIWAAVAASAVFWLLRLAVAAPVAPTYTAPVTFAATGRGDWSRVLGSPAPAAPDGTSPVEQVAVASAMASRFKLLGVVAPKNGPRLGGVALLAVDGAPAKAYRVGAVVEGTTILQAVRGFGVALGPLGGPAELELELPALPPPATGMLPPAGAGGAPGPIVRPAAVPMALPQMAPQPVPAGEEDPEPVQEQEQEQQVD